MKVARVSLITPIVCNIAFLFVGIPRDDRRRIELVVRHFIPDYFGFPRVPMPPVEGAADEEEEEMPPRNDIEEIEERKYSCCLLLSFTIFPIIL